MAVTNKGGADFIEESPLSGPNQSESRVNKAVIPAAGLGTRMLPMTKSIPKELFPVGRKPMIQYAVEEAVASGIQEICIVIRKGKEAIQAYFLAQYPSYHPRSKDLEALGRLLKRCDIRFVTQEHSSGLGDALLQARDFVGTDSFIMMVPDQLFYHAVPATLQLLQHWRPGKDVWCSVIRVRKEETDYFIGARGVRGEGVQGSDEFVIKQLYTERETRELYRHHTYEIRGFGRTIYPCEIFDYLGPEFRNPSTGEVDLLKTFEASSRSMVHQGIMLEGEPFDVGTLPGYYHYLPRLWELTA